jgi:Rod binding domain-containing protein
MSHTITSVVPSALAALTTAPAASKKVVKAASDFETMLISKWLEQVQQGVDDDNKDDAGHDTCMSLAGEALAQGVTAAGGLGLARVLLKHLGPQQNNQLSDVKNLAALPISNPGER